MTLVFLLIFLLYSLLILLFAFGLNRLEDGPETGDHPQNGFSIVVPFRNEEANIQSFLESLRELDYPAENMEVLLIDDASDDDSPKIIEKFIEANKQVRIRVLTNRGSGASPKKEAISLGIREARHAWIATTDADCILPPGWLMAMDALIHKEDPVMIAAPVTLEAGTKFLDRFQLLDFLSLQGATMGGFGASAMGIRPFLCNGANLAYRKDAFTEVRGFEGNLSLASGDDVFLLEKMAKHYGGRVTFLRSRKAIVRTNPEKTWKDLVQQRVRWASKTTAYSHVLGKSVGFLVFAANACLLLLAAGSIAGYFPWSLTGILFLIKCNVDFFLLYRTALFFDQTESLRSYLPSSFLYPLFSVWVAMLSLRGSYQWKGRSYKKAS